MSGDKQIAKSQLPAMMTMKRRRKGMGKEVKGLSLPPPPPPLGLGIDHEKATVAHNGKHTSRIAP